MAVLPGVNDDFVAGDSTGLAVEWMANRFAGARARTVNVIIPLAL
jgi:hypothetical protein